MTERIQAPRGTFDVLPDDAAARAVVEREARRILEGHLVEELLREAGARTADSPGAGHVEPAPPAPEGHAWWVYCVCSIWRESRRRAMKWRAKFRC